ncbi:MAG: hypothetical protein DHS20C14_18910 [Phycisphaeraceae bacterium]|nr:MAG: hypothetical protein DHS20C14_18910 [Phycisphaeraceae bacterium]
MEHNPYAADSGHTEIYTEPERTSLAAVFSLVSSLICCIPGLSLIGIVLGVLALVGIGRSNGRVGGKGLAIAGIVIGLMVTIVQVLLAVLVVSGVQNLKSYQGFFAALDQGDYVEADTYTSFASPVNGSPEHMAVWAEALKSEWGGFVSFPQDTGTLLSAQMGMSDQTMAQRMTSRYPMDFANMMTRQPICFPVTFDQGTITVCLIAVPTEPMASHNNATAIYDAAFEDAQGNLIWLIPDSAVGTAPARSLPAPEPEAEAPEVETEPEDTEGDEGP